MDGRLSWPECHLPAPKVDVVKYFQNDNNLLGGQPRDRLTWQLSANSITSSQCLQCHGKHRSDAVHDE